MPDKRQRILSLDVLRGITVVGMILVNNAGGPTAYAPLCHSDWNGMTMCDMVFPFFLFIVGVTTCISLGKSHYRASRAVIYKIVCRALLILLIGWLLHIMASACSGDHHLLAHLRLPGVLPRIAVCYLAMALMALFVQHRHLPYIALLLLAAYGVLLLLGHGYDNDSNNILAIVDQRLLGSAHLYHKAPIDPEGLVSTLSAVAHTMIGFCCGMLLTRSSLSLGRKSVGLLFVGAGLLVAGLLLSPLLPLNKRIWSPSFVLVTCGVATILLSILLWVVDYAKCTSWSRFFEMCGVNPLFLYVLSEVVAIVVESCGAKENIYNSLCAWTPDPRVASLIYAVGFTLVMAACGYALYRKKIYIKL